MLSGLGRTWGVVATIACCRCGGRVDAPAPQMVDAASGGASAALDPKGVAGALADTDAADSAACTPAQWCVCQSVAKTEPFRGVQDAACSDTADPFIAALEACPGCHYAGAVIVVGNRGGVAVLPPLKIGLTLDGVVVDPAVIDEPIAPGALVALDFQRDFMGSSLTAELSGVADCDASSSRATTTLNYLLCH